MGTTRAVPAVMSFLFYSLVTRLVAVNPFNAGCSKLLVLFVQTKRSAPYWSNPTSFDFRLSATVPKCQKSKLVG